MGSPDQRTFRFLVNGRTAQAYAYGAERVGLVLPADGMTVSVQMTIAEMLDAIEAMIEAIGAARKIQAIGFGDDALADAQRAVACSSDPAWTAAQLAQMARDAEEGR